MAGIQLNASMRANLLALQSTDRLMSQTQERLSTGRKVNSVIDDASAFYSAKQGFQKAEDLSALKADMGEALQKVQTAVTTLDSAESILMQMKGLANQAKATSDTTTRASLASDFNDLRDQLEQLIDNDANYKGTNLLAGDDSANDLVVNFNEDGSSSTTVAATDTTGASYAVADAASSWAALTNIEAGLTDVNLAIDSFRDLSKSLASKSSFIQTRVDFTQELANIHKSGAENLVAADMNEEGANMLALQTQQQLSITALSLSSQAAQSVLRLF
jgi:flagellin